MRATILMTLVLAAGDAFAESSRDGYCDYVEGVASSTSAVLFAPTVYTQFGLVEQSAGAVAPDVSSGGLRLIAGVRVSVDGIYKGMAIRDRARADCRRHNAIEQLRGETAYQALDARVRVLDEALAECEKILKDTRQDLDARRTTAQEATSTRLRVDELRDLAAQTRREMSLLPQPSGPLGGALDAFQRADDSVERIEGKLRRAEAFDVSLRVGFDEFLDRQDGNPSPYFAVVVVGVNLGSLFQGAANARAAAGRQQLVRSGRDPIAADASADRMRALLESQAQRAQEVAALEADLAKQIQTLDRVGGDDSKRYRQTVWFEWVKLKAEEAYLVAHLKALREAMGGGS